MPRGRRRVQGGREKKIPALSRDMPQSPMRWKGVVDELETLYTVYLYFSIHDGNGGMTRDISPGMNPGQQIQPLT